MQSRILRFFLCAGVLIAGAIVGIAHLKEEQVPGGGINKFESAGALKHT